MHDKTIPDLRDRLDALKREQQRLVAERNQLDSLIELKSAQISSFELVIQDMKEDGDREDRESIPAKYMRNEIVEIFKEEGAPLANAEVYRRLVIRGVPVNGQDPVKNVGSHLSLDQRFERYAQGVWGLASWKGHPPKGKSSGGGGDSIAASDLSHFMVSDALRREREQIYPSMTFIEEQRRKGA